jgi:hypothetical protein
MCKITAFSAVAVLALAALLHTAPAEATGQAPRTFVSAQGSDANPCTLGAPCRSFAAAILQTAPNGEIAVLNTAGYGAVTINESITITNAGGVEAGLSTTTPSESAITVAAGSGVVTLRGLTLEGGGVGYRGIDATAFAKLNIIDCVIKDFTDSGIVVEPSVSGSSNLYIAGTSALDNGQSGILVSPTNSASVNFSIDGSAANGNGANGVKLSVSTAGSFVDSHADMNGSDGIYVNFALLSMRHSTANNNFSDGVYSNFGNIRFISSELSYNKIGYETFMGYGGSSGNNDIDGNSTAATQGPPATGTSILNLEGQ